jgi:arylsulfatase A-like enzyme
MTYYAYDDFMSFSPKVFNPLPGSLFLGSLGLFNEQSSRELEEPSNEYPYGVPSNALNFYFLNSEVFSKVSESIQSLIKSIRPVFGYFHLFAPHFPYRPRKEYTGIFPEIYIPYKPRHELAIMNLNQEELYNYRSHYDEYIANVDAEMGKMMKYFEEVGILDNSYIVITSDHGESFERGEFAHGTYLLYEPVIQIPLLISAPGQSERLDVLSPTSSTDILPTLLSLAGKEIPNSLETRILPGLGGQEDFQRSIFAIEAKENSAFEPLTEGTFTLIKEGKKLIYYTGYTQYPETFELYDLVEDIEETRDLFLEDTVTAARMKEELLDVLAAANRRFGGN